MPALGVPRIRLTRVCSPPRPAVTKGWQLQGHRGGLVAAETPSRYVDLIASE